MNINMQEVRDNPHLSWCRVGLSMNKGITIQDILYLELPNATESWDWKHLSQYINIQDIRCNPHLEWNMYGLLLNIGITIRDIEYICMDKAYLLMRDIVPYKIVDTLYDIVIV